MEKAYKYRIYPNEKQKELIAKTFGCVRFVYNHYLAKRIELYKTTQKSLNYSQCSADLTQLKKELIWLKDVDKFALQNALRNLDAAYQKFFKEHSGWTCPNCGVHHDRDINASINILNEGLRQIA